MVTEWKNKKIGDILDFKNGLNKSKEFFGYGTPIVNYTDVYHHSGLLAENIKGKVSLSQDEIKRFEVRKGDVFFTRTSETPEEVGISSVLLEDIDDCVFSGFVLRGRPKNDALAPEYCKYCFSTKAVRAEIVKNCTYTTRALTNGRVLSAIEIPVPEKSEQKDIANILTLMEEHIANLSELIEKKRAIRDGAMTDLLSGATRLEGCVSKWGKTTIGSCADIYQGGTPKTTNNSYWNGNIIWVTPGEVTKNGSLFIYDSERKITESGVQNSSACILPEGTILLCTRATIGALAIAGRAMATNQGFKNLICKRGIDNVFFAYLLLTLKSEMIRRAIGTTFLEISKSALSSIEITIPEYGEQKAIASVLTAMEEEIQSLEEERNKIIQIREAAMNGLLTGQVRLAK